MNASGRDFGTGTVATGLILRGCLQSTRPGPTEARSEPYKMGTGFYSSVTYPFVELSESPSLTPEIPPKTNHTMSASPNIPTRQLGKDGPTIPILGLGLMGLSCQSEHDQSPRHAG
jgi:hypothetical protein